MSLIVAFKFTPADDNSGRLIPRAGLPHRVHVFEDYESEIEKRWWLRGELETKNVPESWSASVPNRQACRAADSKDFDDKQGDKSKSYKAVVFNPVPGPPMGKNTRLSFRYWLDGADELRVQIFSLSKGYHRRLVLKGLPTKEWQSATVDMTQARRPDGSGGPLSEDERIDDIQFYVSPNATLIIDDIVLYDESPANEKQPFPRRAIFTGWFDTGKQGAEWPGDFEIVDHKPPLTWDAARGVVQPKSGRTWIRINMRGMRTLSDRTDLRCKYWLKDAKELEVLLVNSTTGHSRTQTLVDFVAGEWAATTLSFKLENASLKEREVDEIWFLTDVKAELLVDDVLLYEPGEKP